MGALFLVLWLSVGALGGAACIGESYDLGGTRPTARNVRELGNFLALLVVMGPLSWLFYMDLQED